MALEHTVVIAAASAVDSQTSFRLLEGAPGKKHRRIEPSNRVVVEGALKASKNKHASARREMMSHAAPFAQSGQQRSDLCRLLAYQKRARAAFESLKPLHLCIFADASMHSNDGSLVIIMHSWINDVAVYLPFQVLAKPKRIRLKPEFAELANQKKLPRLPAYAQLLAIDHALSVAIGCSLDQFKVPGSCIIRALHAHETRLLNPATNAWSVYDHNTNTCTRELAADAAPFAVLAVFADQGSIGWSGFSFAMHHMQLLSAVFADPNHRVWNDIKLAAQTCTACLWRTICEMTLVFNINYGPFGKGHWFAAKRDDFQDPCSDTDDSHIGLALSSKCTQGPLRMTCRSQLSCAIAHMRVAGDDGPHRRLCRALLQVCRRDCS